jgi:hypothetical protein
MNSSQIKLNLTVLNEIEKMAGCNSEYIYLSHTYEAEEFIIKADKKRTQKDFYACLANRRSVRKLSNSTFQRDQLFSLIANVLAFREKNEEGYKYYSPTAGGVRELRFLFVINEVEGVGNGLWEYIPEKSKLQKIELRTNVLSQLFYEEWEIKAKVNILFCFDVLNPTREYINNVLHTAFEAGAVAQIMQMELVDTNLNSCISGFINRSALVEVLGQTSLTPLYSLSIM